MGNIFDINNKDLKNLKKFYKKAPRSAARAEAGVINDQAFTSKNLAFKAIKSSMEVRSPKFVSSRIRVQKATPSKPISIMGSIFSNRFSGWIEQQRGTGSNRKSVATDKARGGNKANKIQPKYRMKQGRSFTKPENLPGRDYTSKVRFMFRQMGSRKGKGGLFYLTKKYKSMTKGLYLFSGGKISKMQDTDSPAKTKKNKWMTRTVSNLNRSFDLRKSWAKNINRELNKIKPK